MNGWSRAAVLEGGHVRLEPLQADGSIRDTVTFSIIDSEWPAVKRHLQARLEGAGRG